MKDVDVVEDGGERGEKWGRGKLDLLGPICRNRLCRI